MKEFLLIPAAGPHCALEIDDDSESLSAVVMVGRSVDSQERLSHHGDEDIEQDDQNCQAEDDEDYVVGRNL